MHYFILKHTLLTWIVSTDLVCKLTDAILRNGTWKCIRESVMVNCFNLDLNSGGYYYGVIESDGGCKI